jgi:hypothetical protein
MKKTLLAVAFVLLAGFVRADDPQVPPLKFARLTLTVEQVTNLNTTPVAFLPPVEGFFYAVTWSQCFHTGRYATSPGLLVLRVPGGAPNGANYLNYTGWSCLVRPTVNGNASAYDRQFGIGATDDSNTAWGSKGAEVFVPNGNPTASEAFPGSEVTVAIYYRLLPSYLSNLPE